MRTRMIVTMIERKDDGDDMHKMEEDEYVRDLELIKHTGTQYRFIRKGKLRISNHRIINCVRSYQGCSLIN